MDATVDLVPCPGGPDDFPSARLESDPRSRPGLARSHGDPAGRYGFGATGEAREVVDESRDRRAPSAHLPQGRAIAVKVAGFAILAVAGVYRWSYILSLVPQPYRSVLCTVATAVGLCCCVLGPKMAAGRRNRE